MTPYTERRLAGCYEDDGSEPGEPPAGKQPKPKSGDTKTAKTEPDTKSGDA